MNPQLGNLRVALEDRKLNSVIHAVSELAGKLRYQLKPPYTDIVQLKAQSEGNSFVIEFSAKLLLHYSSLETRDEGLVFEIQFGGEGSADSPNPPVHELFALGQVNSFKVYGYGDRWDGQTIATPNQFAQNLEVTQKTVKRISTDDFFRIIETGPQNA